MFPNSIFRLAIDHKFRQSILVNRGIGVFVQDEAFDSGSFCGVEDGGLEVDSEDACGADDGILPVEDGFEVVEGVVLTNDRCSRV